MSDLKIKVDGKDYPLPELNVDQWLKVITSQGTDEEWLVSLFEKQGVERTLDFYYLLLHDTYPELTKNKLRKMPMYQLGIKFTSKVMEALTEIPLDSEPTQQDEEKSK